MFGGTRKLMRTSEVYLMNFDHEGLIAKAEKYDMKEY